MIPLPILSALRAVPWRLVGIGLLLLALGVQTLRANHYEEARDQIEVAFKAQQSAYRAAQSAAAAKAVAARIEMETRYARHARDASQSPRGADFRRSAARYADTQRVRPEAARGASGGAAAPGQGDPAPSDHGPGSASEFLWISRRDFDILAGNTERLIQVNDWGRDLIGDGLALPEPAFGQPAP